MFSLNDDLRKLKSATNKLQDALSIPVGNITFDYEEQELIRRIFKSVFSQLKSGHDKKIAKTILRKTEWINGKIR
jgi:hypothetical protein